MARQALVAIWMAVLCGVMGVGAEALGAELLLSETAFEFTVLDVGKTQTSVLTVINTGAEVMEWVIEPNQPGEAIPEWLMIDPMGGSLSEPNRVDVSLTVDAAGLSAGRYEGAFWVVAPGTGDSGQRVTVELDVTGPFLVVREKSFSFSGFLDGANPDIQLVRISNAGVGTLYWTIEPHLPGETIPEWLVINPMGGSCSDYATAHVSVDLTGLAAGNYSTAFNVTAPGARNSPWTVAVELEVVGPILQVSTNSFSFKGTVGHANTSAKTLTISNPGGGTVHWSLDLTDMPEWLSVSPTSGSQALKGSTAVSLSADSSGLAVGSYDYSFGVLAPGAQDSPQTIHVTFNVYESGAYGGGNGTEENPFLLSEPYHLLEIGLYPEDWAKVFLLTDDIDMSRYTGIEFSPIGTPTTPFSGMFDGNGNAIRNLTYATTEAVDCVGLFGALQSATVCDVTLENLLIATAGSRAGGLAGASESSRLVNCRVSGAVGGHDHVGGLVGSMDGGEVLQCRNEAAVTASLRAGGLVGYQQRDGALISNSHNSGRVEANSATDAFAGGITGTQMGGGTVTQCFNTGAVTATAGGSAIAGGLAGSQDNTLDWSKGTISACYNTAAVTASGTFSSQAGGLVGRQQFLFWRAVTDCYNRGAVAASTASSESYAGGLVGNQTNGDMFELLRCYSTGTVSGNLAGGLVGMLSRSRGMQSCFWNVETSGIDIAEGRGIFTASPDSWFDSEGLTTEEMRRTFAKYSNWNFHDVWFFRYDDYPCLQWEVQDRGYSGGSGTAEDPYQIGRITDLLLLMQSPSDYGRYFLLTADLDLAGIVFNRAVIAPDMDPDTESSTYWLFEGTKFSGVFDGGGHTIRNLTITSLARNYMGEPYHTDFLGLFGWVDAGGQVCNLNVEQVDVQGRAEFSNDWGAWYVGGVAARSSGTIGSCHVTESILSGHVYVGGLVGQDSGEIIHCYVTGSVDGYVYVGGLIGRGERVVHCYSTARTTGVEHVGGLCGFLKADTPIEDTGNFWDVAASGVATSAMGTGKTTAEMMTPATFTEAGWDFSDSDGDGADWMLLRAGEDYPRLAWQPVYAADIAGLYGVDLADLGELVEHWLSAGCPAGCGEADIDGSGGVDLVDLGMMAEQWMEGM